MKLSRKELTEKLMQELLLNQDCQSCRIEGQWKIFLSETLNRNVYFNAEEGCFDFEIENSPAYSAEDEFEINETESKPESNNYIVTTVEKVELHEDETGTKNRPSYKTMCEKKDGEIEYLKNNYQLLMDSHKWLEKENKTLKNAISEYENSSNQIKKDEVSILQIQNMIKRFVGSNEYCVVIEANEKGISNLEIKRRN